MPLDKTYKTEFGTETGEHESVFDVDELFDNNSLLTLYTTNVSRARKDGFGRPKISKMK